MGGAILKQRFYIIVLIIAILAIAGIAALASNSSGARRTNLPDRIVCTIKAEIGIEYVIVNNRNTGGGDMIIKSTSLPYSFNSTTSDEIVFRAIPLEDYVFNVWRFTSGEWAGTWDRHNPLTIQPSKDFTVIATVLYIEPAPSPIPTQSVIE
jgi:hypothetical protein